QHEPIERRVALKVLRFNLKQEKARRRFAAERRAMERLDHPNVGKILDAGTTPGGRPYLAVELIDGTPVTDYCDQRELPVEERLHLFVAVCRGVHHAHGKLLLHRDIKPSNVMVAEVDGRPVPKLIDFGIAQALDAVPPGAGAPGRRRPVGTPRYMSPEALGLGGDVDTRSDVFSLGVLLYEMLAGRRPWKGGDGSLDEIRDQRSTTVPLPPSGSGGLAEAAARRGERSAAELSRRLRGDLDAIVMKAIARDPDERYDSAAELAGDVECHLEHRPVAAREATRGYVFGRLLRRHRGAAIATALVVAALLLGAVGTSFGLVRARRAEAMARAEARAAEEARVEAEQVVTFLTDLFAASNPLTRHVTRKPSEVTALELMERGAERLEGDLGDQPRVRARLERTLGAVYDQLGEHEEARRHLGTALTLAENLQPPEPRLLAHTHLSLSTVALRLADREAARRHVERVLALLGDSAEREDQVLRADAFNHLGRLRRLEGDFAAAEEAQRRAIELNGELGPSRALDAAISRVNLGVTFFGQRRWEDAEAEFRTALETFTRELPEGHVRRLTVTENLAAALASQERLEEAAPIMERALVERRRRMGERHSSVGRSLNNLGVLHDQMQLPEQAAAYHRESLAIREETLGREHPDTAWSLDNLARSLTDLGRAAEATPLQERALAIREATYGGDHPEVARSLGHLASLALAEGDLALAHRRAERAYEIDRGQLEAGDVQLGDDALLLGEVLWRRGDHEAARRHFEEALAAYEASGDDGAEDLAAAREKVARLGAGG
ncbi:MAG TPA: serine/threonine-protein kinase, partial [Thermoanaerobaculia bacterium]|nr:serine/threonine-protein kinase [Thermoanaerobaculia bacterium]